MDSAQLINQINTAINDRNTQTQQTVNQINVNKQEALANLDTQMKVADSVGDAGATVTIIFICLFVLLIVLCDLLKLLSYLKIIKPIKMLSSMERYKLIRGGIFMRHRPNPPPVKQITYFQSTQKLGEEYDANGRKGYQGIYCLFVCRICCERTTWVRQAEMLVNTPL